MQRDKKTKPSDNMFYWFNDQHHSRQKQPVARTLSQPVVGKLAELELNSPSHPNGPGQRYGQPGLMDTGSGNCLPYGLNNYNINPFYVPISTRLPPQGYRNQSGIPIHPSLAVAPGSANPTITPRLPPANLAQHAQLTATAQMLKANPHVPLQPVVPSLFPQRLDSIPRVIMPIGTIEHPDSTLELGKSGLDLTHPSLTTPFLDTAMGSPFVDQDLVKLSDTLMTDTLNSTASPSPTDDEPVASTNLELLNTKAPSSPALHIDTTVKDPNSPALLTHIKIEQVETTVTPPTPTSLMALLTTESAKTTPAKDSEPTKVDVDKTTPEKITHPKEASKESSDAKDKAVTTSEGHSSGDTEANEDNTEKPSRKRRCFRELVRNVKCGHTGCGRLYATESSLQNHIRIKHNNIRPENAGNGHVSRRHSSAGEKKSRKNATKRKLSEAVQVPRRTPTTTTQDPVSPTPINNPGFLHSTLIGSPLLLCSPEANNTSLLSSLSPSSDPEWSSSLLFDVDQAASLALPDFFDTDFSTSNSLGLTPGSLLDTGLSGNLLLDDWLKMDDLV